MTQELTTYISGTLRATLPWIDEIAFLGRKSVDGYTLWEGEYVGITDKKGSYGYIRFNGDKDHEYLNTESRTSRGKWLTVRTELRLVLVADLRECGTPLALESNIVGILSTMDFPPANYGKVNVSVVSTATDFERIFREETDVEEISWADHLSLIAVDFVLSYVSNNCCEVTAPTTPCSDASYLVRYETEGTIEEGTVASGGSVEVVVPDPVVCEGGQVVDDQGNLIANVPEGATVVLPDITVTQADGSSGPVQPQVDVVCDFPELELKNTAGTILQTIVSYPALGDIMAPDGAVKDDLGNVLASVPSGGETVLPDITVTQADGSSGPAQPQTDVVCEFPELELKNTLGALLQTIVAYPALGDITAPNGVVKDDNGNVLASVPSGGETVLPDITVTQVTGLVGSAQPQTPVVCAWPLIVLNNTDGDLLQNVAAYPPGGVITAPNATVLRDGAPYGTVPAGDTINVPSAIVTAGIFYQNDSPICDPTSYANYDTPWLMANGYYTRVQPTNPATIQRLDYGVTGVERGYILAHQNLWGHKFRFTGRNGGYFDPSSSSWRTLAGGASTYAAAVPDLVVFDHLTGKAWFDSNTPNAASWSAALPDPAATVIAGQTGWRIASPHDCYGIIAHDSSSRGNRAFQLLIGSTTHWLGTTPPGAATAAHIMQTTKILSSSTKTTTNRVRAVWKFFS